MTNFFQAFIKGIFLGFSCAAPVGPIGILCIRRTLSDGMAAGLFSGLGAATADAVYGAIIGFGLTSMSNFLIKQQTSMNIIGGIFLFYLGIKTFFSKPAPRAAQVKGTGLFAAYVTTFFLTMTNPMTIIFFTAIIATMGIITPTVSYMIPIGLVAGIFTGAAFWWFMLSFGVGIMREKLNEQHLLWINKFSGLIIIGFATFILASLFK